MKKFLTLILLLSSFAVGLNGQSRGTPNTIIVKVDANGYLVVAGAAQTNPVTQGTFSTRVLRTDANGALQVVLTGGAFSGQFLAPVTPTDCSAPGYSFVGDTNTGMGYISADIASLCAGGTTAAYWSASSFNVNVLGLDTSNTDIVIRREAAGHWFQRNGANAQRASWTNTYTSSTNYESFSIDWQTQANAALVGTRTATTGTQRVLGLVSQGTNGVNAYSILALGTLPLGRFDYSTSVLGAANNTATGNWFQVGGVGVSTVTSGSVVWSAILPIYNQTAATTANTDLLVNRTETSIGSGAQNLIDLQVGSTSRWRVTNTGSQIGTTTGPGSVVYSLSTNTTGDDPTEFMFQNRVATTDATPTTINTITIATSFSTLVECRVVNRRTGGASGAAEDSAGYYVWVIVKNTAGTVAEIAAETLTVVGESVAGYTVTTAPSGATLLVQVTGAANTNVTWHSTCRTYAVNS